MSSRWFVAALLLSIMTALALLLTPAVVVHEGYAPADLEGIGRVVTTDRTVSLWEDQPVVAFILAIPVLLCALPLLARRHRPATAWAGLTLLTVFVLLGLTSVGLFFLPSVVVTAIGLVQLRRSGS